MRTFLRVDDTGSARDRRTGVSGYHLYRGRCVHNGEYNESMCDDVKGANVDKCRNLWAYVGKVKVGWIESNSLSAIAVRLFVQI